MLSKKLHLFPGKCFKQALATVKKPEVLEEVSVRLLCHTSVATHKLHYSPESTPLRNEKRTFKACGHWEFQAIKRKAHYGEKGRRNMLETNSARFTDPSLWQTALLKVQATMINESSMVDVNESAKFFLMVLGERPWLEERR